MPGGDDAAAGSAGSGAVVAAAVSIGVGVAAATDGTSGVVADVNGVVGNVTATMRRVNSVPGVESIAAVLAVGNGVTAVETAVCSGPATTYAEIGGNVTAGCGPAADQANPTGKGVGVPGAVGSTVVCGGGVGGSGVACGRASCVSACCSGCPSRVTRRTFTCAGDARTTSTLTVAPSGSGAGVRN